MIKLVDNKSYGKFFGFCADKPLGIRIAAALLSYGTNSGFADFWLITDESERITGVISKLDGDMTLCAEEPSEEHSDFIRAVGALTVTGEKSVVSSLKCGEVIGLGHIMELKHKPEKSFKNVLEIDRQPSIMEFCRLLRECEGKSIRLGSFERFYTDLSHRVRHGTAKCVLGRYEGNAAATACAAAVTDYGAVVGAVCVKKNFRGFGFGSNVVIQLLSELVGDNKKICLFRTDGENENFYKSLGFENTAEWATVSGKWD